jgi:hypothetical protein
MKILTPIGNPFLSKPHGTAVAGNSVTLNRAVLEISNILNIDSLWNGAGVGRDGRINATFPFNFLFNISFKFSPYYK